LLKAEMTEKTLDEYAKFSTGYAVAALGFSIFSYSDVYDISIRIAASISVVFFGVSAVFGFMAISSMAASHQDGADEEKKKSRLKRVHRYGVWHFFTFCLGLGFVVFLVFADIFTDLSREVPTVKIHCLESLIRGWPACSN